MLGVSGDFLKLLAAIMSSQHTLRIKSKFSGASSQFFQNSWIPKEPKWKIPENSQKYQQQNPSIFEK